jgi:hypothetical protein
MSAAACTVSPPPGRSITCWVKELRPHPGYLRHGITVPASHLSLLAGSEIPIDQEPLLITQERTILDGHARWELARRRGVDTLRCLEYDLSEEEALLWLIQKHQRSHGLNAFCRILLALELEPWFKARAKTNQQLGGQKKGSSNLTTAEKLDVRTEIANAAGASTGNVTKVKRLVSVAHPEVKEALRNGSVSIHQAWLWLRKPERQLQQLAFYQNHRGIIRTIDALLRRHSGPLRQGPIDLHDVSAGLARLSSTPRDSLLIAEINVPGEVLLLSPALRSALASRTELEHA